MIVTKIAIGLIAISTILITLYAISRITIRIIDPTNRHPDFEQTSLAAAIGVLAIALCSVAVYLMYITGTIVMRCFAG
jgi:hypothetical protein